MPDENTNPVWVTQTSQNNQTTINPSWDDFVLDFWDGKVEQDDKISEVEINDLEEEKQQEESWIDADFNDNLFDEIEDKSEPNDEVQEDNIGKEESSGDFDISLDNNEEIEDNNEEKEDNNEEIEDNNEEKEYNNEEKEYNNEEKEDNNEEKEYNNEEKEYNNEEKEDNNEEIEDNNEEIEDNNEEKEYNNEEKEDNDEEVEDNDEEAGDDDEVEDNDYNISLDENPDLENEINNEASNFSIDENSKDEAKDRTDNEIFLSDDGKDFWEVTQNDDNLNLNEWKYANEENHDTYVDSGIFNNSDISDESFGNENSDNFWENENDTNQWNASDLEENVTNNDLNYTMDISQEPLNQPEIWDLLWNSSTDFTRMEPENNTVETENNESLEASQGLNNIQENVGFEAENNESNNIAEESQNLIGSDTENQSFTLDYNYADWNGLENGNDNSNSNGNEISNENIEESNNSENNVVPEENNITSDTNQIENTDQTAIQQISTLSLDQILDTELNNNPQYADNSKAVPINVSDNKWLFGNKKLIWVIAWVGLFLLAGFAVIISPLGSSNKNSWNVVDTGQIVEEFVDDHQVADLPEDIEEDSNTDERIEEDFQWDTSVHESKVTIQDDFPDVDWDDESSSSTSYDNYWDSEWWDVEPYVFSEEDNENQTQELEIWDVLPIISDYKSQAEIYHTQWDEMQDKKLIKYSLQAMNLCDDYQEQIQNGESLDEESFSSFKSKIDKILTKMEEYLGWDSYTESYENDNYYYDFE